MSHSIEETDQTTIITLQRGSVNALDLPAILSLEEAFRTAPDDKAILLTGAGKAFSAGVDTRAFAAYSTTERQDMVRAITRMTAALLNHPAPVVAALNGHALGGGFVLMLCADYRLASDDPSGRYGIPEAAAGVPYPAGPVRIIAHEIPAPLLRFLALSSKSVSAGDLLAHQILDELVPPAGLRDQALAAAANLLAQPAFRTVKQQIRQSLCQEVAELAATGEEPFLSAFG